MGIEPRWMLRAPPDECVCASCSCFMIAPVSGCMAGHIVCHGCYVTTVNLKKACPVCERPSDMTTTCNVQSQADISGKLLMRCKHGQHPTEAQRDVQQQLYADAICMGTQDLQTQLDLLASTCMQKPHETAFLQAMTSTISLGVGVVGDKRRRVQLEAVSPAGPGLEAVSPAGPGLEAVSPAGPGLEAVSPAGHGLEAVSPAGHGLEAVSPAGHGLEAVSLEAVSMHHPSPAGSGLDASPVACGGAKSTETGWCDWVGQAKDYEPPTIGVRQSRYGSAGRFLM
ncbi:hypothetical protein T484DRAFT_1891835 [Baffinella frigidus]|nr:hypothetical protein T484DRAFT_1891835 [Cryptophyta sp. CCMP2293]